MPIGEHIKYYLNIYIHIHNYNICLNLWNNYTSNRNYCEIFFTYFSNNNSIERHSRANLFSMQTTCILVKCIQKIYKFASPENFDVQTWKCVRVYALLCSSKTKIGLESIQDSYHHIRVYFEIFCVNSFSKHKKEEKYFMHFSGFDNKYAHVIINENKWKLKIINLYWTFHSWYNFPCFWAIMITNIYNLWLSHLLKN